MLPNETKAVPESIAKGTDVATIFGEAYALVKKFATAAKQDKDYWTSVDANVSRLRNNHHQRAFSVDISEAVREELRRYTELPRPASEIKTYAGVMSAAYVLMGEFVNGDQNGIRTNRYWDALIAKVEEFDRTFKTEFAADIILAVVSEIHRKYRSELDDVRRSA